MTVTSTMSSLTVASMFVKKWSGGAESDDYSFCSWTSRLVKMCNYSLSRQCIHPKMRQSVHPMDVVFIHFQTKLIIMQQEFHSMLFEYMIFYKNLTINIKTSSDAYLQLQLLYVATACVLGIVGVLITC